jgi:hypothetical protein
MASEGQAKIQRLWDAAAVSGACSCLRLDAKANRPVPSAPYVPRTSNILLLDRDDATATVWMPDTLTGTRLVSLQGVLDTSPRAQTVTEAIPSRRRLHCVMQPASSGGDCLNGDMKLVADDIGNVYSLMAKASTTEASPLKRLRTECEATVSSHAGWNLVVGAQDHLPDRGCLPAYGSGGGWVGLHGIGRSLVCTREHFLDSRVVDAERGAVVKSIRHMHAPMGVTSTESMSGNSFVCAEGPLLNLYDMRTSATTNAASHRCTLPSASFSHVVALGAQRPHEIATCQTDRSIILWDVRNWTRVATVPAVLKYATASLASLEGGSSLLCAGVDSEVRIVSTIPVVAPSAGKHSNNPSDVEAKAEQATDAPPSSFRNRINETEHCESTWHGTWSSFGKLAVGMAITGEVYKASVARE